VKLGKVDYDGRIARYLIAEQWQGFGWQLTTR
jgi:hypothetical protein